MTECWPVCSCVAFAGACAFQVGAVHGDQRSSCVQMQYMKGLLVRDPDEIRTIFVALFAVFEPCRLFAGYYGNLGEKVCNSGDSCTCSHCLRTTP